MDVIEIDAASNRGINEMRELRENVRFRPARDRYKVFIVDEAHQITSEAFNALLKTLEEPPEWVVFILCTTETHKIPSTIASRCQQFSFRSVDFAELVARMEWIIQQEGIQADPEVLSVLAQAGEGSVRDSLSALDQAIACCGNKLEAKQVRELLGMFSLESLGVVTEASPKATPRRCWTWSPISKPTAAACSTSRASWRATSAICWWCGSRGNRRAWWPHRRRSRNACSTAARQFSEDDLTRDLKLALDLFRDLQSSLQPRLHLEMGLLRLIHAGRLQPIEEAIAALSGSGWQPPKTTPEGSRKPCLRPKSIAGGKPGSPSSVPTRAIFWTRLYGDAAGSQADACGRCGGALGSRRDSSRDHVHGSQDVPDVPERAGIRSRGTVWRVERSDSHCKSGKRRRCHQKAAKAPVITDEASERALAHPEVKRFQEPVPGNGRALRAQPEGERNMKMPGNMQSMMQQAQKMQQKMQEEVALIRVEASAGGGMVTVSMDGQKNVTGVKIDPEVAGDVEMLQDLVMAACNEAHKKVEDETQKKMSGVLGRGLGLPPGLL